MMDENTDQVSETVNKLEKQKLLSSSMGLLVVSGQKLKKDVRGLNVFLQAHSGCPEQAMNQILLDLEVFQPNTQKEKMNGIYKKIDYNDGSWNLSCVKSITRSSLC